MAIHYYGVDKGEQQLDVVATAVDPTKDVQVEVDLASGISRSEVLEKLRQIANKILEGNWPPA